MDLSKKCLHLMQWGTGIFCCISLFTYFLSLILAGGSIFRFLWFSLVFLFLLLPGLLFTELFLPTIQGGLKLPCTFLLGSALLLFSYLTFGRIEPLLMGLPLVPLAVWQLLRLFRQRNILKRHFRSLFSSSNILILVNIIAAGLFIYAFSGVLGFAHASAAGNMVYHQDMMWSVGNAAAVQLASPLRDIRTAGSFLYYHYLGDALMGFAAMFSHALPYEAVCFYGYPLVLFFLVIGVYAAARQYGASALTSAGLPFALLFLNGWRSENTLNLLRNMNGVATATALTAALLILIFEAQKSDFHLTFRFGTAFTCGMLALLMAKNLYGILLCCALGACVLFGLFFQRRFYRSYAVLTFLGFFSLTICWLGIYRHAINNLVFTLWQTPAQLLRTILVGLPLGVALWAWGAIDALCHFRKASPCRLLVNAAALGSLMAFFIFHHYSASQIYFLLAAFLFFWFGALDAVPLLARVRPCRWAASALMAVSLICTAFTLLPVGRTGIQIAMRCIGVRPEYAYTVETLTADDEAAALWLRDHLSTDDIFAVNRNSKNVTAGDGTWHYYTAVSGRQCFLESWRYSLDYGSDFHEVRYRLEEINDVLFAQTQASEAFAIAQEQKIRYLLVSKPLKPDGFSGARPVFENEYTAIYEVPSLE